MYRISKSIPNDVFQIPMLLNPESKLQQNKPRNSSRKQPLLSSSNMQQKRNTNKTSLANDNLSFENYKAMQLDSYNNSVDCSDKDLDNKENQKSFREDKNAAEPFELQSTMQRNLQFLQAFVGQQKKASDAGKSISITSKVGREKSQSSSSFKIPSQKWESDTQVQSPILPPDVLDQNQLIDQVPIKLNEFFL